jgi:hypothetical protein
MTYELLQGAAIGVVMGASFILGRASTFKERSKLQAELTRLTDRDDHGRYVKAEGEAIQYTKWEPEITTEMADHIGGLRNKVVIGMNAQPRIESTKVARKPRKAKT